MLMDDWDDRKEEVFALYTMTGKLDSPCLKQNIPCYTAINQLIKQTNTNYISITSGTHSTASDDPLWIYDKTVSSFKIYHCSGGNIDGTLIAYPHWYTAGYVV